MDWLNWLLSVCVCFVLCGLNDKSLAVYHSNRNLERAKHTHTHRLFCVLRNKSLAGFSIHINIIFICLLAHLFSGRMWLASMIHFYRIQCTILPFALVPSTHPNGKYAQQMSRMNLLKSFWWDEERALDRLSLKSQLACLHICFLSLSRCLCISLNI